MHNPRNPSPHPKSAALPALPFGKGLLFGNLAVFLLLLIAVAYSLQRSHDVYLASAKQTSANLAHALSLTVGAQVKQIDNALQTVSFKIRSMQSGDSLTSTELRHVVMEQASLVPDADVIRVTDSEGVVLNSGKPTTIADRAYFKAARASPDKLIISEPLQGRLIQKWGVILARAIVDANGSFRGLVYSNLSSDQLIDEFNDITLGAHGAVALRSETMALIARYSPASKDRQAKLGTSDVSPQLRTALAASPTMGTFVSVTAVDGTERLNSFERLSGYSPIIFVGIATDDFLAPWWIEVKMQVALAALLQGLIVILSIGLHGQHTRQLASGREAFKLAEEREALLENQLVGMVKLKNRREVWHNHAMSRLFGYGHQELDGISARILYESDESYAAVGASYSELAVNGLLRLPVRMVRKDGSPLWIDLSGAQLPDGESLWMMVDITEVMNSEAMLAASEKRLKAVTDNLPAMIAYVDRTQTYQFANAYFKHAVGVDPERVVGQTMSEFLGEQAHKALTPHIEAALSGERRKFERTGWAHNANNHFLVDYVPDVDQDGRVSGFFVMVLDISERRSAELALARSELRVRMIADNLPAMISHFDRDLRYTFANAKVGAVFGCSSQSLLGRSIREVRGEEVYSDVSPKMFRALAGEQISFEASTAIDGRRQHFEANYIPEVSSSGEVLGFYAFTFEVTHRKEAERMLRASQQLLERTGTLGGIGGWELDLKSNEIQWTEQTRRIHEVADDYTPTVDAAISFYVGDAQQTIEKVAAACLKNGEPWDIELPLTTAKNRSIWVRATGEVEFENGTPLRMFGAFQDITERVLRERQLREQSELLQVTLKSIGDAVITTDAQGMITWMNPVAERMTGWLEREAKGRPLPHVFHILNEHSRELAPDPVSQCLKDEQTVGLASHTLLLSRDGSEYGIQDSAAPIRNETGALLGVVLVFHDVSEQRRLSGEMSYRATHDALTGLVNRAEFEDRLQRLLTKSYDDGDEHALLYIDLDQFKLVNDACGHAVGDQLLQQVSKLLGDAIRTRDTLARLGGDEFAIIMEHCNAVQALRVAEKICARMDDFRFIHEDRRFRIGASIGLVPVDKRWSNTAAIQQAADTSCYAAKEAGRNRVHAWFDTDAAMRARHVEMQWTTRIEQALDENYFALFAQRIESLSTATSGIHAEVLLRLMNPDGSVIAPGAFLPAAERFHLASRVDRWVLQHVIDWMNGLPDISVIDMLSVNLSGQSVGDRSFHQWAIERLEIAGNRICSKLCFEVTETAAVTNMADAIVFIEHIRAVGVKVALDDFGAGASSFGYLKSLKVDILKIDGQFVRDLLDDPLDAAAVRCFTDVARIMSLKTVAEFVDQSEILDRLKEMQVDYAQGFLLHRPAPIDALLISEQSPT